MTLVTIASKLDMALRIRGDDPRVHFDIIGNRDPNSPELRGWGLTYDVDQATFDQFMTANPHLAAFITIATQEQIDAATEQSNTYGFEPGLAPPDPTVPPIETPPPVNRDVPYAWQEGGVASCTMGNWENYPTHYNYQWMQDGTTEVGMNSSTLSLVASDNGHTMTCIVQAVNAAGFTDAPPSNGVVIVMSQEPTSATLTGGGFSDQELAGMIDTFAVNPTVQFGFDILVDNVRRMVSTVFGAVTSAADICAAINSQLGAYATVTMPMSQAPWSFVITSNTTGALSTISYAEAPTSLSLFEETIDPNKKATDCSITMRLRMATDATLAQGQDGTASEGARGRSSARVPASVA